ncbi:hypothetical protein X975_13133, partial [Stegodyphus mimosarum]
MFSHAGSTSTSAAMVSQIRHKIALLRKDTRATPIVSAQSPVLRCWLDG